MDDLFGDTPQPPRAPPPPQPKPLTATDVRAMMVEIIAALKDSETIPFAPNVYRKHKAMFPIMAQWLPEADGEALIRAFETEVSRLS